MAYYYDRHPSADAVKCRASTPACWASTILCWLHTILCRLHAVCMQAACVPNVAPPLHGNTSFEP